MAHLRALLVVMAFVSLNVVITTTEAQGLAFGFYRESCPQAEATIFRVLYKESRKDPAIRADILRLHFHDCFVRGCDASVLLEGRGTERAAPPNFRLEAFKVIYKIKEVLEYMCPQTVSCADILAFAARDGVAQAGGPQWEVRGGRRDGVVSKATEATANLPGDRMNVEELTAAFARHGLTRDEMVTLSGAHTIGDAACVHIDHRIQGDTPDPLLPADYLAELKAKCPKPGQRLNPTVAFDRQTDSSFDTKYYENLVQGKGLLSSDQVLFEDPSTRDLVVANTNQDAFFASFTAAMVKMSEIDALTGSDGQIRLKCKEVNKGIKIPAQNVPPPPAGNGTPPPPADNVTTPPPADTVTPPPAVGNPPPPPPATGGTKGKKQKGKKGKD